jgi:hypothetical protein
MARSSTRRRPRHDTPRGGGRTRLPRRLGCGHRSARRPRRVAVRRRGRPAGPPRPGAAVLSVPRARWAPRAGRWSVPWRPPLAQKAYSPSSAAALRGRRQRPSLIRLARPRRRRRHRWRGVGAAPTPRGRGGRPRRGGRRRPLRDGGGAVAGDRRSYRISDRSNDRSGYGRGRHARAIAPRRRADGIFPEAVSTRDTDAITAVSAPQSLGARQGVTVDAGCSAGRQHVAAPGSSRGSQHARGPRLPTPGRAIRCGEPGHHRLRWTISASGRRAREYAEPRGFSSSPS